MERHRKRLKDSAVGVWLSQNAPDVLKAAGELSPVGGSVLRFVADKIGRKDMTPEQLETFEKLHLDAQAEVTKRWEADMSSDAWLPKNVRPLTLVTLMLTFLGVVIADSIQGFPFDVPEAYVSMLEVLMTTVFTAYFAGRSFEKIRKT